MAEYQQGPPPAGEVNIDGNTTAYDAEGNMSESQDMAGGDALDGAFGDDTAGGDMPLAADDPMGAALDDSAAQSDAGSSVGQGQGDTDTLADLGQSQQDDGIPKQEEDDQSGGAAG